MNTSRTFLALAALALAGGTVTAHAQDMNAVRQRMEQHVRIAMPQQSAIMRNKHAAQPQAVAGHQTMNVEPHACCGDHC